MLLVSLVPDIKRTFQYHGAEHKTIFCYENDLPLTRSEEHTSELQSLSRISYAVFCLKKGTVQNTGQTPAHDLLSGRLDFPAVAEPPDRDDMPGVGGLVLHFHAQTADVDIHNFFLPHIPLSLIHI